MRKIKKTGLLLAMLVQCLMHSMAQTSKVEVGMASYYAQKFEGRTTASGEVFSNDSLTAAHRSLPFGTFVKVTNLKNGWHVVLRINDRGPFKTKRIIDVSQRAAKKLGFYQAGLTRVKLEVQRP